MSSFKERILSLVLACWVLFAPIRPSMAAVFLLPVIDLILALVYAKRSKQPITSSGIKRTVAKVFLYELATILAFVTETYLTGAFVPAIKMVTGLIGVTELKSCLEHLDDLGGQPLFASLLSKLAPPNDPNQGQ
jgi:hypothetical protein